jgi:hypothetical protein
MVLSYNAHKFLRYALLYIEILNSTVLLISVFIKGNLNSYIMINKLGFVRVSIDFYSVIAFFDYSKTKCGSL